MEEFLDLLDFMNLSPKNEGDSIVFKGGKLELLPNGLYIHNSVPASLKTHAARIINLYMPVSFEAEDIQALQQAIYRRAISVKIKDYNIRVYPQIFEDLKTPICSINKYKFGLISGTRPVRNLENFIIAEIRGRNL